MSLVLAYGTITVTLSRFSEASWPRRRIETAEISRTAFGTPNERGTSYEPPHLWQVSALVSDFRALTTDFSDADKLQAIYDRFQIVGGDITLSDYTRDYSEPSPQSRTMAAGGAVRTLGTAPNQMVRYPAVFNVRFSGELVLERQTSTGLSLLATFQLVETTKVVAT